MATISANGQVCICTMLVVVFRKELASDDEKEGHPSIDTWKFSNKGTEHVAVTNLNASTCQSFSSTLSEKSRAICGNSTRNWRRQFLEADYTVITLCSMQSVHVEVYSQMGGDKSSAELNWASLSQISYQQSIFFFGSVGEVSSRAKFVQRTYKPLSQPHTPHYNFFQCIWM